VLGGEALDEKAPGGEASGGAVPCGAVAGRAERDTVSSGGAPGGGVPASIAAMRALSSGSRRRDTNLSYAATNVSSGLVRKLSGLGDLLNS
jgi:hypothetical protein